MTNISVALLVSDFWIPFTFISVAHRILIHTHTQSYPLAELRVLVEAATRQRLDDYQFQSVQRKPLDENRHGRRLTLGHYNIKTGDTLFLMAVQVSCNQLTSLLKLISIES